MLEVFGSSENRLNKTIDMLTMSSSTSSGFLRSSTSPSINLCDLPPVESRVRKSSLDSIFCDEYQDSEKITLSSINEEYLHPSDSSRTSEISPQRSFDHLLSPQGFNCKYPLSNSSAKEKEEESNMCRGCHFTISDRYILHIGGQPWHESCVKCSFCGCQLTDSCFVKDGRLYCKQDYVKVCKTCEGCGMFIADGDIAMKAESSSKIFYHVTCFSCFQCKTLLQKGDKYILSSQNVEENASGSRDKVVMCKNCWQQNSNTKDEIIPVEKKVEMLSSDTERQKNFKDPMNSAIVSFLSPKSTSSAISLKSDDEDNSDEEMDILDESSSKLSSESNKDCLDDKDLTDDGKRSKRPRTILNAAQRRAFKRAFEISPKPCRKVRETLASETGLTVRVVQVWFQNQRAKIKKLAKRQRSHHDAANAHFKHRGYFAYDPLTPLPHQIPPIMTGNDVIGHPNYMPADQRVSGHHMPQPSSWDEHRNFRSTNNMPWLREPQVPNEFFDPQIPPNNFQRTNFPFPQINHDSDFRMNLEQDPRQPIQRNLIDPPVNTSNSIIPFNNQNDFFN